MLKQLPLRIAAPTMLLSFLLLTLSIVAAVYLYRRQASSEEALTENISSNQVAHDLENTINDAILLLQKGEQPESLHDRIRSQLAEARNLADKPEEQKLVGKLEVVLGNYFKLWQTPRDSGKDADPKMLVQAQTILEHKAIPLCGKLQEFNARQIKESGEANRGEVRRMILGLIAVSSIGSLVGLVLGYSVARRVGRSIYHLRVHVQDAAQKLGQDLPDVSLVEGDDLQHLHDQLGGVVQEIEQVVERLRQREREVLRAEQLSAVGQLAAGVAHELRNPLTSIKMLIQTNREETLARQAPVEDLDIIEHEIRRMERSLQNFLNFARPPRLERRPLDLTEPIDRTLALVAGRATRQHVEVRFDRPKVPVIVEADREQMQQVLVNLTLNALDVLPRGGMLQVELDEPVNGQVEIRVADNGPGIAPDIIARIFEPFITTKETGLGLGLVISRRIAESHGGSLHACNRKEGGACFVLRVPCTAAPETAANHRSTAHESAARALPA